LIAAAEELISAKKHTEPYTARVITDLVQLINRLIQDEGGGGVTIKFRNKKNSDFTIEVDGSTKNEVLQQLVKMCRGPASKWEEVK